jgi:tetratricopeptide (TPR) repeat protein
MTYASPAPRDLIFSAIAELKKDHPEAARPLLERALEMVPNEPVPLYLLGTAHYRCGNYAEAEIFFRRSLAISPGQPDACFHLAQTLRALKRPREAIDFCHQVLKAKPGFVEASLELAQAETEIGATGDAESRYRGILATAFNLTAILNLTTLLNQQDCFAESEALLRQALQVLGYG